MRIILSFIAILILQGCSNNDPQKESSCPLQEQLLSEFQNEDGLTIRIYSDGNAYFFSEAGCQIAASYFEPDFYERTFNRTDSGVYWKVDDQTYLATIREAFLTFEEEEAALDLIRREIDQNEQIITNFTLQSPAAPTVADYIALQSCILEGSCDFIDNRFDLAVDPLDNTNKVLRLFSVAPEGDMITSKTSMVSSLVYFEQTDDFWFEAKYYVEDNLPTTLADFESSFFTESPGPRILVTGTQLAIENKFAEKRIYRQSATTAKSFPTREWVTVRVHLKYDTTEGIIQLWQNGELLIDTRGPNIPFDFWIQDRVEFGISATSETCTMYMDDVRFSDHEF